MTKTPCRRGDFDIGLKGGGGEVHDLLLYMGKNHAVPF